MATVRMTLAAAGLMVFGVCGMAFAGGPAGPAVAAQAAAQDQSEASGTAKPKAADSVSRKKMAKTAAGPKAGGRPAGAKPAKRAPASGRMQVEEPKAAAPANPARESKAWQKSHARGLTAAQKQAFRERKENMEGMIAVIKEKRKALRDAKPEERAALTRELHSLILEKDPADNSSASSATARVGKSSPDKPVPEAKASGQASQREDAKKSEAAEERRKRIEALQEQLRKKEEIRKQQLEKYKSGLESSLAPAGGLSQGLEED